MTDAQRPTHDASSRMRRLAIVATPIGNLQDLSPRAAEVLKAAQLVLCEDTRHSKPLLDRVGSHARLVSCHAHNERERCELVVESLARGDRVALITDAGAPAVSDPGGRLVEDVVGAGHMVEVVPGASALTAALMGAGIDLSRFSFLGFLPKSGKARRQVLESAYRAGFGMALYESPQRVAETLDDLFQVCGPRRVVVARELTKLHETFHRGVLGGVLAPALMEKGELVVLVEQGEPAAQADAPAAEVVLQDTTVPPKERARRLAAVLGITVKEAYARVQDATRAADDPEAGVRAAQQALALAARHLLAAENVARAARGQDALTPTDHMPSSETAGINEMMALLSNRDAPALRAPVEAREAAQQLLAAVLAADALLDALGLERESRRLND